MTSNREDKLEVLEKQVNNLTKVIERLEGKLENLDLDLDSHTTRSSPAQTLGDNANTGSRPIDGEEQLTGSQPSGRIISDRSRAQLDSYYNPVSPSNPSGFGAADVQRDYERLRDSLIRVPVPHNLRVHDTSSGLKQDCRPILKVISKCARYSETGLKVLSQIPDSNEEQILVSKYDLENLFIIFAAQNNFLQSEYASLVVRSTFNEDTSRIFRSFENNQASFSPEALQNVRVAAELASTQARFTSRGRGRRGRGQGYRNYTTWRGQRGGESQQFPLRRPESFD